jgi:hypothetical protein
MSGGRWFVEGFGRTDATRRWRLFLVGRDAHKLFISEIANREDAEYVAKALNEYEVEIPQAEMYEPR